MNANTPSSWPSPSWTDASGRLARRVERRERFGAFATAFGTGLAAGATLALGARFLGAPALAVPLLVAGALGGLVVGLLSARRLPRVGTDHAAWALDRLAGARERGLTAALLGVERAGVTDAPPPEPPHVRLHPPRGLSLLAGGGVLAALVFVVAGSTDESPAADGDGTERVVGHVSGSAGGSGGGPEAARQVEQRALEAERVRRALGLSAAEGQDPAVLEQRLADADARAAARAAAAEGGALARALAGDQPSGDAVAKGLGAGARAAETLEEQRRAELARAGANTAPPLPAARRALVERYFDLRTRGTR